MTSLQDLLTEHRIRFSDGGHRHVREGWIGIDCPWCGSVGKFHLGVHVSTLRASCWRCGFHPLGEVLAQILSVSPSQGWGILKNVPKGPRIHSKAGVARGSLDMPKGLESLSGAHQRALRGRGFDPEELERLWGIKGLGNAPQLGWRIWIPVHLDGEVVSWTTRSIGERGVRYINAGPEQEVWPIKSLLYGWDFIQDFVFVCEGPTDVWRIGPGAIATFGVNVSVSQMEMLSTVPKRIVCFDNEKEAKRRASKLCRDLSCFPGETLNVSIDSNDPGDATDEEVKELLNLI